MSLLLFQVIEGPKRTRNDRKFKYSSSTAWKVPVLGSALPVFGSDIPVLGIALFWVLCLDCEMVTYNTYFHSKLDSVEIDWFLVDIHEFSIKIKPLKWISGSILIEYQ